MNTKITESEIENFTINLLEKLGFNYIYGPDIAPDSENPERETFEDVILIERLRESLKQINPKVPQNLLDDAIKQVKRIASPELIANNETFHRLLTEGIQVTKQKDGSERGDYVHLVDFKNPENNEFLVVNQFTVVENHVNKRPDIVLFINGLPLVVIELKNPVDEKATVRSAYKQIGTYKEEVPSLFTCNSFVVISDGLEARAGTLSSELSRFMAWKSSDGKVEASPLIGQLETLIKGMLNKSTLLDLIRHFIVFEKSKKEDKDSGQITIQTVKKLAAYHQYYAVNRAVESTLRASGYSHAGREPQVLSVKDNSPPVEGWQTKSDGVVKRDAKNYFKLPYNPKLKAKARELRKAGNLSEVLFWNQVKNKQFKGYDFDRQKIIGNYIVDFFCSNCNVVIEIDGESHDGKGEYDTNRDAYLESLGLTVIHILAQDILKKMDVTMQSLFDHPALKGTPPEEGNHNETNYQLKNSVQEENDNKADVISGTLKGIPQIQQPPRQASPATPPEEGNLVKESPESYGVSGVKSQPVGDKKGGVVWHTQGSGKSLSMVFYTGKIVLALDNPTLVVITDRNDLDDQLFDTFAASKQLLRQEPVQAENRDHLKKLLSVASGGIVFTTIQKFSPEEGNVYETLTDRKNVIVIADEAHRTQYGFKAKTIDEKDYQGHVIGKKIAYGFAKYLRDALPNATYLGFTGTPIESTDVNTPAVFGNYVDVYDIGQAVQDGATVRIYYESRLAKITLSEEGRKLVSEVDDELKEDDLTDTQKAKVKWTQLEALIGSDRRIKQVAQDIINHFQARQEVFDGKAMIVCMSRRIAAELYDAIVKLKQQWHNDDLKKGALKVVMTSASSDGPKISRHHTSKDQRRALSDRMKDPQDELKLVIVCDMWLTGFDVPSLHTLYIDKPMRGHNLMQAIARVNRVYKDKTGGLVVDYLGIASDLKKALSFYSDSGGKGDPAIAQEKAVSLMLEKLEVVAQFFHDFPYEDYFDADTSKKLSMILAAEDHILGLEDGKKRYINEVTLLSQAFSIAMPHDQANDVKDEIAFFQAVKSRLAKFEGSGTGKTDEEIETAIRQVIDKALVTDKVIDVFDAAGIKKPNISILSEEFLLEVKNMEHKNLALEVLKKLLSDEIKARTKKNLIQSKSLLEMLESSIKKYHNKILTAAEVIEELIALGKDIQKMDQEPKEMGMTDMEYAFYTAIADNKSAKELMQKDKLRELAVVLFEKVKANASIDWTIKESVKAKLKVIIKRTLRQFGYPPDMQKIATETVLKQAELIANELTNSR